MVFHIGYLAERGHYTVATVTPNSEILYFDDRKVFRLKQSEVWEDMFNSHKPFDTQSVRFKALRQEPPVNDRGGETERPPSIGEQPRTPYLLIYASTFHRRQ